MYRLTPLNLETIPMIAIPRYALRAALHCAATKDVRHYLCGVHLECTASGDVHIVATTGAMMFAGRIAAENVAWTDEPQRGPWRMTIPIDTIKRESKGKGHVILQPVDSAYRLGDSLFTPVDGMFPDWRRVIPVGDTCEAVPVDPDLLVSAHMAVRDWHDDKGPMTSFTEYRRTPGIAFAGSVVRVVGRTSDAFAIVMPLRVKREDVGPLIMFTPAPYDPAISAAN